jgi:drug/metabolite transporter (DMT)-like permease
LIPADALLAVLAAAFLHAAWNAIAKGRGGQHPLAGSFRIAIGAAASALPLLAFTGLPAPASAGYVAFSGLIHVGYFVLIALAYRFADYSAVYPLIRGGAPLFTTLLAAVLLGETLAPLALAGVALLCAGIVALGAEAVGRGSLDRRSLVVAAVTAAVVVTYTLVDGLGARASGNAAAYVLASAVLTGALVFPLFLAVAGRGLLDATWPASMLGLAGGAMANLSYGIALWAMTKAPIGLVGAVRETSVLFATLIAAAVLRERFGRARWLATVIIVAGLAMTRAG